VRIEARSLILGKNHYRARDIGCTVNQDDTIAAFSGVMVETFAVLISVGFLKESFYS
jgi:hypothetical protein